MGNVASHKYEQYNNWYTYLYFFHIMLTIIFTLLCFSPLFCFPHYIVLLCILFPSQKDLQYFSMQLVACSFSYSDTFSPIIVSKHNSYYFLNQYPLQMRKMKSSEYSDIPPQPIS